MKKIAGVVFLVMESTGICFAAEQQSLFPRERSYTMHEAICTRRPIEIIRTLLSAPEGRAALTRQNKRGNTPLHEAVCFADNKEVVHELLSVPGGSVALAIQNNLGETPLHRAVEKNASIEMVHTLLSAPGGLIALAIQEDLGETPLHCAVYYGRSISIIRMLLLSPGGHIALVMQNENGENPVHEAIYADHSLEILRVLLENSFHAKHALSMKDNHGKTPIDIALEVETLDQSLMALLFSAYKSYPDGARSENAQGRSEGMQEGLENDSGHEEAVVVQAERDPEKIRELTQRLHNKLSRRSYPEETVSDFIRQGALVSGVGELEMNALHCAIKHHASEDVLKSLVEAPDAKEALTMADFFGDNVLHLAVQYGVSEGGIDILVNCAESQLMDDRNKRDETVLYIAFLTKKSDAILEMLLNLVDSHEAVCSPKSSKPLLHYAVESGCSDDILARLMVWVSAEDLIARDAATRTALHYAVVRGVPVSTLKTLIEGGVDAQARTHRGKTALDFAYERGHIGMHFLSNVCNRGAEISGDYLCCEEDEDQKDEEAECPICCEVYSPNRPVKVICDQLHEVCSVCAGNKRLQLCPYCRGALVIDA